MQYYIVVEEWLYPTESGREIVSDYSRMIGVDPKLGDETDLAIEKAKELSEAAEKEFESNCGIDCLPATRYDNKNGANANMSADEIGYIVTSKSGLDDWYFAVRIIPVSSIDSPFDPSKRI